MARAETSRQKILKAASELAFSEGAAHMSLDAVAARAGVSKGGLLYNFPNKAALMRALVQQYLDDFRAELEAADGEAAKEPFPARYLQLVVKDIDDKAPPSSGLLAALAEDPCMLAPVKAFNRELVDRMKSGATDTGGVLVLFLALEGLRAQNVFGTNILDSEERRLVLERLAALIDTD